MSNLIPNHPIDISEAVAAWWKNTRSTEANLVDWLKKQYHGETTAAERVKRFAEVYCHGEKATIATRRWGPVLAQIGYDEARHASWIAKLLDNRGVTPEAQDSHNERYWTKTLGGIESFESGAAVAAHAETMRLERIRAIAADITAPHDVKEVFNRILGDEEFHAGAFTRMAGDEALKTALSAHKEGLAALGLIAVD